ncbi:Arginine N-methyltransferase 2 [Zalerion maritima]|uniref:Protein arginine N-methyltransferase 2 n=1 Tax=Zalerion maritima TaxID=339359 RepID=A0AAD5RP20_9PEZI|nr:Arginine N-methyltransferase 2 [Zalerion maritima]
MASSPGNRDSLAARIPSSCPGDIRPILSAAWSHDLQALKPLLDEPGKANAQEPTTRETPLHAAIRSCGPSSSSTVTPEDMEKAKAVVAEIFLWGGIWNDVDDKNETPGCVALRLGLRDLYDMCVAAGMRAEMLFGILDGYEELDSGDETMDEVEDEEQVRTEGKDGGANSAAEVETGNGVAEALDDEMDVKEFEKALVAVAANAHASVPSVLTDEHVVTSDDYLASGLTYDPKKLVDDAGNGVMMAWETDIMRRSAISLLSDEAPELVHTAGTGINAPETTAPSMPEDVDMSSLPKGKRILNIGFGMGIIDSVFASTKPSKHHIIEAHPAVLSYINTSPESKYGPSWVDAAEIHGANKVWSGRWQDICPKLLADGEVYDAIYFDTFGEDYSQLKLFFTEYIPGLLDMDGKFGFFNGLGADRKICYDVYQKVAEMHLTDAGMDVEWQQIDVDMKNMGEDGMGEWEGVVRRYWTLDSKFSIKTI